ITEPSREVDPNYAARMIATKDGKVHVGLVVSDTPKEVVLRDAQNREVRIRVDDIEERATESKSLMPESLLRDLTAQQAADLLESLPRLGAAGKGGGRPAEGRRSGRGRVESERPIQDPPPEVLAVDAGVDPQAGHDLAGGAVVDVQVVVV